METPRVTALIAAGLAIIAVVLYLMMDAKDADEPFQAYDGSGDAVEVADTGLAVPSVTAMKRAGDEADDPGRDVPRDETNEMDETDPASDDDSPQPDSPAVDGTEDTLNRPGPAPSGADPDELPPGKLDRDTIRKGIEAVTPLVKVCYEGALEDFPSAEGKITVGFRIIGEEGKGRVEMSELDPERTTLFDEKLHDCMLKTIGDAEFESPEGGAVTVRYPFVFETDAENPPEDP